MTTYYHVTDTWEPGDDLKSWDLLSEQGYALTWKWEDAEEGYDGDLVSLHRSLDDAIEHQKEFGGSKILAVEIDAADLVENAEGYPCVRWQIPAAQVSIVQPVPLSHRGHR